MADPLALADFWEKLRPVGRPVFVAQQARKGSSDGQGNMLSAAFGVRPRWNVAVQLAGGRHNANLMQESDLTGLGGRDGTFLAYDIRTPYPASDPEGWRLGDSVITVKSIGANNRSIALEGFARAFTVTKTDKLSILYSSSKRFLCEVRETVTGSAGGETAEFEVWPFLPPGIIVGDVVTLRKSPGKFKIVAGSYRPGSGSGNMASGPSFSMISVP